MTQIISYLTFNGNCREAMHFYRDCLGGELQLQTIGESPMADKMPPRMREGILHASLTKDGLSLMASDMVGEQGLVKGNSVSLMLNCSSEAEIKNCYASLARDGQVTHPLENTYWGALFGDLTDKFGHHWLLHFEQPKGASSDELPAGLAAPARRALASAGITTLTACTKFTEKDLAKLHGIGKNALTKIKKALADRGLSFRPSPKI